MVDPLQIIGISLTVVFICLIILGLAVTIVSKVVMKVEKSSGKEEKG